MKWNAIDIHCHTNFAVYTEDRHAVIERSREAGVALINVGTQKDTSRSGLELARMYDEGVYATVGLHPIHTDASFHDTDEIGIVGSGFTPSLEVGAVSFDASPQEQHILHQQHAEDKNVHIQKTQKASAPTFSAGFTSHGEVFDIEYYKELAKDPKVVAIGECGLDYFHTTAESEKKQRDAFSAQITLANEVKKPLMLHVRNGNDGRSAYADVHEVIKREAQVLGNVHFFAGTKEEAQKFLDLGFTLSFTGVITFAKEYEELVRYVPLEMMHAETDAPYVTPVPYRGKRNEPLYVLEVIKKIAEIKGKSVEAMQEILMQNVERLFGISFSDQVTK